MNKIFNKSYIKKTITYQAILSQDNGAIIHRIAWTPWEMQLCRCNNSTRYG